ncbi:hypothetical protein [Kineococcus rubinsiae]|uniref:hypothetical protein n=1 Tax=Kineococcus rubinsiae TaxID=2609562 RepID=UPI001430F58D|nr:hypothetical protein [Kineococcus rubinsiae]NIZ89826.1 hypothetical protein [Kineococcus rubinsiae]
MSDHLSREHLLRVRAEGVRAALEALWGDQLPDSPDPVTTVLVDAVAVDDQLGLDDGLVVQGDGLSCAALARIVADVRSPAVLHRLPPELRARIARLLPSATRLVDLRTSGDEALPSDASGAWEYDLSTGTVSWDARAAVVWGLGQRPGTAPWPEWLQRSVHEEDRASVDTAVRVSATTGLPCEARFRVPPPRRAAVVSRGRVLTVPGGGVRILGFSAPDDTLR